MANLFDGAPVLFANTGIQIICFPLPQANRKAEQMGQGWHRCRCKVGDEIVEHHFVQWQAPSPQQLLLAVDTTMATEDEDETGYFCRQGEMLGDFQCHVEGLLGPEDEPLQKLPDLAFIIRSATAEGGEPKDVHLVIDFGNNRTGGLLIEFHGDVSQDPLMHPLQLTHRVHLDAWDEKGDVARDHAGWWFSSRSHWTSAPYLPPPEIEKEIWVKRVKKGVFGEKEVEEKVTIYPKPDLFQDISQVRLGREAHDLSLIMKTEGEVRTSVSSPKRYLWARDPSWLDGANWYMADPTGRYDDKDDVKRYATTLRGPMMRYLSEDDRDDTPEAAYDEQPIQPRHAPRTLMMGAMYELLAQAYTFANSTTYRRSAGEQLRLRRLRSVTLTYPSGMILAERQELERQAKKAIHIFNRTLGRAQDMPPEFHLSIDEASAVHLTYIWSDIQKLGRNPGLWFQLMGRKRNDPPAETRPGKGAPESDLPEVRVACIDIGGGTTDLMIASYTCQAHAGGDRVIGRTLHRDGIYLAGDHLVKRILERVIVPKFKEAIGLDEHDAQRLFGPEVPGSNREFRAERVMWINRLFVPLAQAYLDCAVRGVEDQEINHEVEGEIVAEEVLESLQATIDEHWGADEYQVAQPLGLYFNAAEFEKIVDEVFCDLLLDFCETIVEHDVDVVLLAGLPTKLESIQDLVRNYLPLPSSRIVPMYHRYVGNWYPYQNPDHLNPGVIVDPKSTVVVGAAVEFSARYGMLSQFKFKMKDDAAKRSYFWGVMTESRIDSKRILFPAGQKPKSPPILNVSDRRLVIGRKRRDEKYAQASPVYVIKVDVGNRLGEIDVNMKLARTLAEDGEEQLEVVSVDGDVAGEPAELGENVTFEWRTLADDRYYLDNGGLDKIEFESTAGGHR